MDKKNNNSDDMTLKEVQYLIKQIEKGTLGKRKREKTPQERKENGQRLVLKLIEEFGELAENIRKNVRYDGKNIKDLFEKIARKSYPKLLENYEKYIDDELEEEEVEEYEDKMDEIMGKYSLKEFEKFLDKVKLK